MKNLIIYVLAVALALTVAAPVRADNAVVDIQTFSIRNATKNEGFSQSIDLATGEEAEFSVGIINASGVTAGNVQLHVYLPFDMHVVNNSLKVNGVASNSSLTGGFSLGNLASGEQKSVIFRARTGSNLEGFHNIQAQTSGNNTSTDTKFVFINVLPKTAGSTPTPSPTASVSPSPSPSITLTPIPSFGPTLTPIVKTKVITKVVYVYVQKENMSMVKVGRNVTEKQEVPTQQISARPGDELEFSIQITSASDKPIENVIIKDTLPEQADYIFNVTYAKQMASDQLFRNGLTLGNLQPHESKTISYRVRLQPASAFGRGETKLTNVAETTASNAGSATASASVFVNKEGQKLLGGVIAFGGFSIFLIVILAVLALLFISYRLQEKKRLRVLTTS